MPTAKRLSTIDHELFIMHQKIKEFEAALFEILSF